MPFQKLKTRLQNEQKYTLLLCNFFHWNKKFKYFVFAISILSLNSFAGGGGVGLVGNGGHGVICHFDTNSVVRRMFPSTAIMDDYLPNTPSTATYLLDLIELESGYHGKIDLYVPTRDEEVKYTAGHYNKLLRKNMDLYLKRLEEFPLDKDIIYLRKIIKSQRIQLIFDSFIPASKDLGKIYFNRDLCGIQQLAFRQRDSFNRIHVYIDAKIVTTWYMMSADFSALILHEKLHAYFTTDRSKSTLALRQFVGYLSADAQFRNKFRAQALQLIKTKQPQSFR